MTTPTRFRYPARDGLDVAAYRWDPDGPPRGVVQLTHGMGEHLLRYADLAAALTARGFVVYGQDHRGHGATAAGDDDLGRIAPRAGASWSTTSTCWSPGSARSSRGCRWCCSGTAWGHSPCSSTCSTRAGASTPRCSPARARSTCWNPRSTSTRRSTSPPSTRRSPARTDYDWLSRDEAQVDAYVAVGDQDPVNGQLALVHALVERYRAAGLTDVTLQVYAGARHEVFNETNRDDVVADLLAWLDRVVPAG